MATLGFPQENQTWKMGPKMPRVPKGASQGLGILSQVSFQPRSVARVLETNPLGIRDNLGGQSHRPLLVGHSKSGGHCEEGVRLSAQISHQTMDTGSGGCGQHVAVTKVHCHPHGNSHKPCSDAISCLPRL